MTVPAAKEAPPIATFQEGVNLISFDLGKKELRAGELVDFRARWRLDAALPGSILGIKLVPLQGKGEFLQELVPIYGLWGSPPSSPGTCYEQRGKIIVPSNAPSGRYALEVGLATQYPPPQYQEWITVGEKTGVLVQARPLPTNGP
jgi:hypothetical protein